MKPVFFEEANATYSPSGEVPLTYGETPAYRYSLGNVTCWRLTLKERVKLLCTGTLWVDIPRKRQPAIKMAVTCPFTPLANRKQFSKRLWDRAKRFFSSIKAAAVKLAKKIDAWLTEKMEEADREATK